VVDRDEAGEEVLTQTRHTFEVLRQPLQAIDRLRVAEPLDGAVRVQASITQVQRFEIAD
jgi:hypothetical protein